MFGSIVTFLKARLEKAGTDKSPTSKKGRAFYMSLFCLVGLFVYGDLRGADTTIIVSQVTNLALLYIGGAAVIDSVRQYKQGDINSPEKKKEIANRYKDR